MNNVNKELGRANIWKLKTLALKIAPKIPLNIHLKCKDPKKTFCGQTEDVPVSKQYKKGVNSIMSRMIAYCGLVCANCPTFLATQNDDDIAREKTAAFYSEKFGFNLKPEEINCDGCISEGGKLIGYCQSCEIRKCCREKALDNCTICDEQPCEKLIKFHEFSPDAKASFDALIKQIS